MCMSKTPLKRVYFDSNMLRNWPNCSNELWAVFDPARHLKTEIFIPQTVEDELESQFLKGVRKSFDDIFASLKQLDKRSRGVIDIEMQGREPSETELREAFRTRSEQYKKHYNIATVPLTTVPLANFVEMAINRVEPFEEIPIDKTKNGVVGLQDSVILFSIMEHMRDAGTDGRCAFITADAVFTKSGTKELLKAAGIELEVIKSLRAFWDDMFDLIIPRFRDPWVAEMKQIQDDLNAQKDAMAQKILDYVTTSEFWKSLWTRARETKTFSILDFGFTKTDLPERQYLPPKADEYGRPEGSQVKISVEAKTSMQAVVEKSNFWALLGDPPPNPNEPPALEDAVLSETLDVSLIGTVHNGRIVDFEVTGVEAASR